MFIQVGGSDSNKKNDTTAQIPFEPFLLGIWMRGTKPPLTFASAAGCRRRCTDPTTGPDPMRVFVRSDCYPELPLSILALSL
jgi:hypothetical protein